MQLCSSSNRLGFTGRCWAKPASSLVSAQAATTPDVSERQARGRPATSHAAARVQKRALSGKQWGQGSTRARCARLRRRATGSGHWTAGRRHGVSGTGRQAIAWARARSCSSCAHCARIVLGSTTSVPPCGMGAGSPAAPPGAPASAQPSSPPPPVDLEPGPAAPPAAARPGASSANAGIASGGSASAQAPATGCAAARPLRWASRSLRMSAIMLTVLPRPCARRPAR